MTVRLFVSYSYGSPDGTGGGLSGHGCTEVDVDRVPQNIRDVRDISTFIEKTYLPGRTVVILFFREFG